MRATDVLEAARAAGVQLSATPAGMIRWRCPGPLPGACDKQAMRKGFGSLSSTGDLLTWSKPTRDRNRCCSAWGGAHSRSPRGQAVLRSRHILRGVR
jgi:hypothetical protein